MTGENRSVFQHRYQTQQRAISSRLPGFYELPIGQRRSIIQDMAGLASVSSSPLGDFSSLSAELVNVFIENGVGTFALPLGIATNFLINGQDVLVPMAVEESSVIAAASHGAKLARLGGGFQTSSTAPIGTGQVQVFLKEPCNFEEILSRERDRLIAYANEGHDRLTARGGGARAVSWRYIEALKALVLYIDIDTRDAMGANMINTMCERLGKRMQDLLPCELGLRILTNLCDKRIARARCTIPSAALANREFSGEEVVDRIEQAYLFAAHDIYRATTHNKGVMNGIDPVVIATGNDWRAVESGAHAYSCRTGVYQPMTRWWKNADASLEGEIELPMALGTVGGVTNLHPTAQAAIKLLGTPSAQGLAEIVVAVGLAQNLSALRALASEGIQRGHMSLHESNLRLAQNQGAMRH
ncbi:MAG: hydroxymethylglutaryl-CoA reductase, degradative [Proteobacteria bacterium]|nr:hydroxymethylglutaryl-CoA reductase, degradative [Pseudomonadota bacterium]